MDAVTPVVPRWEWRAFGGPFPGVEAAVLAAPHEPKSSHETYVVCASSDVNVKIRHDQLDVKRLQRTDRGLELWMPVLKAPFPISAGTIADLFAHWALTPPPLERDGYTVAQFLGEIVPHTPALRAESVTKARIGAVIDGCAVEVASLVIGTTRTTTVAVEHADPDRVLRTVAALGLSHHRNLNYVNALKHVLGIRELAHAESTRPGRAQVMKTLRNVVFALIAAMCLPIGAAAQTPTGQGDEPEQLAPVDVFQGAGILIFKSPDDQFKWWLDGRINLDTAYYFNSDNTLANGTEIRRARLAMNMQLWKTWAAQFDVDFVDNAVDVKDMWIGYTGVPNVLIRAGNFKAPFGLETLTSSRYISFMERSLIDNFSPDRRMGIGGTYWRNRWQASGGVFGPEVGDTIDTIGQDQTHSVVGRFTALPYAKGNTLVHVGVAAANMQPTAPASATLSDANRWRERARPESHVNRGRFIDTGQVKNVDHVSLYGVEAAATFGPLSVQSEYNKEVLRRTISTLPEPSYAGGYAYVSWFPTGEHRPYDRTAGEFGRVIPKSPKGALELLARYSTLDLNDPAAAVLGGREKIVTIGANWYANANVRLMTNVLFVNNDGNAKGDRSYLPNDKFNVLQMRLAMMF